MKVSGQATLHADPQAVYAALNDPAVLVRTIPGCQRLEQTGEDTYAMTVTAGVASISGTFSGVVRLTDQEPPAAFVLRAAGSGAPGTVTADVQVTLAADGDATRLSYDADAVVGGMVGGVGQRLLAGVARKTAGEFFKAVDDVLTGKALEPASAAPAEASAGQPGATAAAPTVYTRPADPAPAARTSRAPSKEHLVGAIVGAGIALLGVLVGRRLANPETVPVSIERGAFNHFHIL